MQHLMNQLKYPIIQGNDPRHLSSHHKWIHAKDLNMIPQITKVLRYMCANFINHVHVRSYGMAKNLGEYC